MNKLITEKIVDKKLNEVFKLFLVDIYCRNYYGRIYDKRNYDTNIVHDLSDKVSGSSRM